MSAKKEILLVGGGGHCKACIDVIESTGLYTIVGIIDVKERIGETILGYSIIGCDNDLEGLRKRYSSAILTVGQIENSNLREKIFSILSDLAFDIPTIVANTAYVAKSSQLGKGTIVMHGALVNAHVKIGNNCIINSKSLLEHDVEVGHHCHISTAATLNGNVKIGNNIFIGSRAVVKQGVKLSSNIIVGMGSTVLKSISKPGIYFGTPVKIDHG